MAWPYYSESNFTENNQNISKIVPDEINTRIICPHPFKENSSYQNYYNKRITKETCNTDTHSAIIGIEVDYNEYFLPQSRNKHNRPLSPPPQDYSKNYHAMVYIPYNHIEGYRPIISSNQYYQANHIFKSNNLIPENTICDRFYQQKAYHTEIPSSSHILPILNHRSSNMYLKTNQINSNDRYSSNEPPLIAQTSVKSTQTLSTPLRASNYFHNIKCKSISPIWKNLENYNSSNNRHNFPSMYSNKTESLMVEENNLNCSKQTSNENKDCVDLNNYLSSDSSKKLKFMERGAPEGAASVSPTVSAVTSPSSPHFKSFYAMNV